MTDATETAIVKKASSPKPMAHAHPPSVEMVKDAIVGLKERTGSSENAIGKYIEDKHRFLPPNFKKLLLVLLKKLVAAGKLTKVKNTFMLPAAEKSKSKSKPKPVTTKKGKAPEKKAHAKAKKVATSVMTKKVAAKPKAVVKKPMKVAKTATVTKPGKKKAAVKKTMVAKMKAVAVAAAAAAAAKVK